MGSSSFSDVIYKVELRFGLTWPYTTNHRFKS